MFQLPDSELVAFYGTLFAMSAIDGSMDAEEINTIMEIMDLEGISASVRSQIQSYLIDPPIFEVCLQTLSHTDETLRKGVMLNLIEVAWADDVFEPEEAEAIQLAQQILGITDTQVEALQAYVNTIKHIHVLKDTPDTLKEKIQTAISVLTEAGIPAKVVAFSSSALGLHLAGTQEVFGSHFSTVLGTGIYRGLSKLFGQDQRKMEKLRVESQRKTELFLAHLQEVIQTLAERIQTLQVDAEQAELENLDERLKTLQHLFAIKRRRDLKRKLYNPNQGA